MKRFRCIVLVSLLISALSSLKAQTISGNVINSDSAAINEATISLLKAADSSIVRLQVSNDKGEYNFLIADTCQYFVTVSSVGYNIAWSKLFVVSGTDMQLTPLVLNRVTKELNEVVVTSKKPMIKVEGDKMVLQVEGSINGAGNTVLELLRKSPGITVNQDDKISMNAKNGVQVFIDGRPVNLSAADLAAHLKSIQSTEVEAIEFITNPSAKYEAAGNAGIINIRLKKNKAFGTNGSVNAGYNVGTYSKYNTGMSFNHRTAKLNVFGNYQLNSGLTKKDMAISRTLADTNYDQQGRMKDQTTSSNFKLGTDFFINKQHTLGFIVNGNFSNTDVDNKSTTMISKTGKPASKLLVSDNQWALNKNNVNANINYLYSGAKGKTLNLNADYGFYDMKSNQMQPNAYYKIADNSLINTNINEMISPSNIDIISMKADYEQPLGKGKLSVGGKIAYVSTMNDFQRYKINGSDRQLDKDRSNQFEYKENINAAYVNYNQSWKYFSLQTGVRIENTVLKGVSTGNKLINGNYETFDSTIAQNYLNLFPSIAINYSKNNNHQFSLSVSRRIDRPDYQDLNPFEIILDDYLIQKGNSYLRPQYTSGISMNYIYKNKLNTSINYSKVKDVTAWITDTAETSKAVLSKRNLASQKVVALNVSYPFEYKKYSAFFNLSTSWSEFSADFGKNRIIKEQALGLNLYMQHSIKFGKSWAAELTGFYNAPSLQEGNMRAKSFWSLDAGIQRKLLKDKATLKFAVSDVFNTLDYKLTSSFAGQTIKYNLKGETRQMKLTLSFRLGSNDVKSERVRKSGAEDEMKRVK